MVWVNASEAGRLLQVSRYHVPDVAREAGIRTRKLPGQAFTYYNVDDCRRVASEYVVENGLGEKAAG
jgi:hypothetical protein